MASESDHEDDDSILDKALSLPIVDSSKLVNKEELKHLILDHQSSSEKGYYTFQNWGSLHQSMFGLIPNQLPQTPLNLWRILKLINFGDDYIPTGLIYDTLITLMLMAIETKSEADKAKAIEEVENLLKSIFFKFIEFNGKYLSGKEKQQLAFFKVIRPVAEGYRKIIYANFDKQGHEANEKDASSLTRNEQLFKMHDVLVYKKNLSKLKKIEEQFKQCTFEPDLSYTSHHNAAQSRYMEPSRIRQHQHFVNSHFVQDLNEVIPEEDYDEDRLFKANPVPLYPETSPIGINEHLERMQRSRQIKKINSLRVYSSIGQSSLSKSVKQFGISQRDKERKQKMLSNFKILFMIKVEVAKRIYRVKVRQNMGISDVVAAIELMVGFKHPDIEEIVKGYFINWEMRQNRASDHPAIHQFSYEEVP